MVLGFFMGFFITLLLAGGAFYLWEKQGLRQTILGTVATDGSLIDDNEVERNRLRDKEAKLNQRESELGEQSTQVMTTERQQKEREKDLVAREKIVLEMEEKLTPKANDLQQMIDIFEDMEAAVAAPQIKVLYDKDPKNTICILKGVKEKWAAEVLQKLDPKEAASIIKVLINGYVAPTPTPSPTPKPTATPKPTEES